LLAEPESLSEKWNFRRTAKRKIDKIHRKVLEGNALKRVIVTRLSEAEQDRLSYRIYELSGHFSDLTRVSQENTYNDALSIANIHEGRHRSFFENSSIVIAGLAGGFLGALLTSLLTAH
jgi:hypothetical protein